MGCRAAPTASLYDTCESPSRHRKTARGYAVAHPITTTARTNMPPFKASLLALIALLMSGCSSAPGITPVRPQPSAAAWLPRSEYLLFVVSESSDDVALVRFGPDGAAVERSFKTGLLPTEINGPHGVAVAPDGG